MSGAVENLDGTIREDRLGHAVDPETRLVRFLSVSALEKADMSTHQGCLRRWWYRYIMGLKEPDTDATRRGNKLHKELARYLVGMDGAAQLSAQIVRGLHQIEKPGPDLFVEHPMIPKNPATGKKDLALAKLYVSGIPVEGAIDLMHERGTNIGTTDIGEAYDPPGTVTVKDWKFPGGTQYSKTGNELPRQIQMAGYATYVFTVAPSTELIRISHGIMPVKGRPITPTKLVRREDVAPTWEHAGGVARSIAHAARETNPDRVEANTRACNAFNKRCIHATYCTAAMHNSLASIIGQTAADNVIYQIRPNRPREEPQHMMQQNPGAPSALHALMGGSAAVVAPQTQPQQGGPLSALSQMGQPPQQMQQPGQFQQSYQGQALPPGVTMAPSGAAAQISPLGAVAQGPSAADVAAEMAKLQAEEAARAAAAQQMQQPAQLGLLDVCSRINAMGRGFPGLVGQAAMACAAAGGQNVPPGTSYPGQGEIGAAPPNGRGIVIDDPAKLYGLLGELERHAQAQQPAPPPVVQPGSQGLVPGDTPPSNPQAATSGPPPAQQMPQAADAGALANVTETSAKKASKKKGKAADGEAGPATGGTAAPVHINHIIRIYVNCGAVIGEDTAQRLEPIADGINKTLSQQTGVKDIRYAPKENPLAYGGWRGAVASATREVIVPNLTPGAYAIHVGTSELHEVVIEQLQIAAIENGWLFVRGG